jgi:hypothetical protein
MIETSKTTKDIVQDLIDEFGQLAVEAEKRRKTASASFDYYKLEFADGEKLANESAAKKLKAVLSKI